MKQNEVATLPANKDANMGTPVPANAAPAEGTNSDAGVAGRTTPVDSTPGGADLLIPALESKTAPQSAATGNPGMDLLYDSAEECPAAVENDKDAANDEQATGGVTAGAQPARRQLRKCEQRECEQTQEHKQDDREFEVTVTTTAWSLIALDEPEGLGSGPQDKSGKRSTDKAGRVFTARADAAWHDSDIPLESGDRMHRVAIVANTFIEPLHPPKMSRPGALPARRPVSRAACERRCGSDGFCDPSDPLGCGGLHCGQQRDMLY